MGRYENLIFILNHIRRCDLPNKAEVYDGLIDSENLQISLSKKTTPESFYYIKDRFNQKEIVLQMIDTKMDIYLKRGEYSTFRNLKKIRKQVKKGRRSDYKLLTEMLNKLGVHIYDR